jgi:hypothetical protein
MNSLGASHRVGYGVLVIGILTFLVISFRGYRDTVLHGIDFNIVYSSSKCLLDHCDPYDYKALFQEYTDAGGIVSPANAVGNDAPGANLSIFQAFPALYPPSSIFWVTPFTLLPFKSALAVWMTSSALLFAIAVLLIADLCRQSRSSLALILLGVFVATSTNLVTTGQPSSFAISLCAIGVWSLLSNRLPVVGVLCFALSLTLKPQVAGLVLVYFLLAAGPARRRALLILGTTALLCVPGIVWVATIPAAAHWPESIRANLAAGARPGSINDPGPTNFNSMSVTDLQAIFAVFDDVPRVYNLEAEAVSGALILIWAYVAIRAAPSRKKDLLGVAAIVCLGLLPLYHRHYDARLLLLTLPAVALLMEEGGWQAILSIAATIAVICGTHPHILQASFAPEPWTLGPLKTLLLLRTSPLACLFAALVYLTCFATTLKSAIKPSSEAICLRPAELAG